MSGNSRLNTLLSCLILLAGHSVTTARELYFGETAPGDTPVVFAKDIISQAGRNEFRLIISPDQTHIIYNFYDASNHGYRVMQTHQLENGWSQPKHFTGTAFNQAEAFISPDGQRLYYSSSESPATHNEDSNIWIKDRLKEGWGPARLAPFNTRNNSEWFATETLSGKIFFARFDAADKADIFVYHKEGPQRGVPVTAINTSHQEYEPFVAADESYMIFSSDRPGGQGRLDLYISYNRNGWTRPVNLGSRINNNQGEYSPMVSPDGKYLFFSRDGDIYWVSLASLLND